MNKALAKQFIGLLARKSAVGNCKLLPKAADLLDDACRAAGGASSEYEFSLVEGIPSIRMLHLSFWKRGRTARAVEKLLLKREEALLSAVSFLGGRSGAGYDLSFLRSFFSFNRETGSWPVQFGAECADAAKPVLKAYLSVNGTAFPLDKFCGVTGLDHVILAKQIGKAGFDSVGVDLLPDGRHSVKLYPRRGADAGLLCRIGPDSKIVSVKGWRKFPLGLPASRLAGGGFMAMPAGAAAFLVRNDRMISYVCAENGRKSVYFR